LFLIYNFVRELSHGNSWRRTEALAVRTYNCFFALWTELYFCYAKYNVGPVSS